MTASAMRAVYVRPDQQRGGGRGCRLLLQARRASWAQTHYIKATNTEASKCFGWGLDWNGRDLAVGAEGQYICPDPDPDDLCNQRGAVYVLR